MKPRPCKNVSNSPKELLRDWERTNVEPFEQARAREYAGRGLEEFLTFVNLQASLRLLRI